MKKTKTAVIFGIVCCLLTIAICIQIKTIEAMTKEVGKTLSDNINNELIDEVLRWKEKYDKMYKQLTYEEENLEVVRSQAIADNEEDKLVQEELKNASKYLGLTEVKGPGIEIKLDDNRNANEEETIDISGLLVHEGDLLKIVNELFNAGADAISINGKRIISTTSIFCDGNIMRVNGETIGVPITIKAIGYPENLYYNALLRPYSYLQIMIDDGVIVEIKKSDNITIPKYEGVYTYEYIRGEG